MSDRFADIEPFLAVAELASFRKAAERLAISPAAVSKAIARLERRAGARLFARTTRRVALTGEGEILLEKCRLAARELDAGYDAMSLSRQTMSGVLTVTAPLLLGGFLAALLPRFLAAHPDLQLRLATTDRRLDILEEHVDVAIRIGDPGDPDLKVRRLARLQWVMVGSPDYFGRHGRPANGAQLANHRALLWVSPSGNPAPWRIREGDAIRDVTGHVSMLVDQGDLLAEAALAGAGIAQVFRFMVEGHLQHGKLVSVLDDRQPQAPPLNAVLTPGRDLSLRVRALLDFLYAGFAGL